MVKKILLSTVLTVALTVSSVAQASGSGLSNTQLQQLKVLKIPVVLPSYIPTGFKVEKVEAIAEAAGVGGGNHYKVTYRKNLSNGISEFYIEHATGGIGDVGFDVSKSTKVKTKFGNADMFVDSVNVYANVKFKNCIATEWLEYKHNFYRIGSGGGCSEKPDNSIQRVSKEEAIKILKSFSVIK